MSSLGQLRRLFMYFYAHSLTQSVTRREMRRRPQYCLFVPVAENERSGETIRVTLREAHVGRGVQEFLLCLSIS